MERCNGSGTQKLELYPYQTADNYDDMSVYTQYWHLTDRQAELLKQYRAAHALLADSR